MFDGVFINPQLCGQMAVALKTFLNRVVLAKAQSGVINRQRELLLQFMQLLVFFFVLLQTAYQSLAHTVNSGCNTTEFIRLVEGFIHDQLQFRIVETELPRPGRHLSQALRNQPVHNQHQHERNGTYQ